MVDEVYTLDEDKIQHTKCGPDSSMNFPPATTNDSESLSFLVTDGTDPLRSIRVLVVKPLLCPKVEILQSNLVSRRSFLYLNKDASAALSNSETHLVNFTTSSQSSQTGLLLHIPVVPDAYQLMEIDGSSPQVAKLLKLSVENEEKTDFDDGFTLENQDGSLNGESSCSNHILDSSNAHNESHSLKKIIPILKKTPLASISAWAAKEYTSLLANAVWVPPVISMKRHTTIQSVVPQSPQKTVQYNLSPQNEQNPRDFIISRYYNTLYSLTTPLSYFPKTAFNRLRNMCKENQAELLDAISGTLISTEDLRKRQIERFGLSSLISGEVTSVHMLKFERENQLHFASRHYDDLLNDQKLDGLVMDLKIREAQLQVLVIMEFLLCSKIDETLFLESNAKRQEKENQAKGKRSLVRKRNKQRIIPTLLGQGMDDTTLSQIDTLHNDAGTQYSLYKSLLSLIDQLGIWGVFQAKSSSRNDEHTYGFLAYVLLPYYNKALPQILQFIIKSFRNLKINFKAPKKSASRQSSTSSKANTEESIEAGAKRKLKFAKIHLSPGKLPFLKKSSSTMDASDLKPAFLLKRSKSSLGSKNMQKRQVDMLGKAEKSEEQINDELKSQSLFLFCDARKIKSVNMATTSTRELPQVEATPTKPTLAARTMLNPVSINVPQVFETPSNVRVIDRLNIENSLPSERTRSSNQKSVFEKLASIEMEDEAIGSPTQLSNSPFNVFLNESHQEVIRSSPEKVSSSPIKVSTKYGDQIAITSSPVYLSQDGLPKDLRIASKRVKLTPVSKSTNFESKPKLEQSQKRETNQYKRQKRVMEGKILEQNCISVQNNPKPLNSLSEISSALASLSNLDVFRDSSFVKPRILSAATINNAKTSSHSFTLNSADTDSDSDLEKLMAAPRASIKKYPRKK